MKKMITLVCLLSLVPAVQAADYKNVKALMESFLNPKKEQYKPLAYWISQLIEIIQHEKKFEPFISALKRAKHDPKRLRKAFEKYGNLFDNAVKVYLIKKGSDAIQSAFDARAQAGKAPTPNETTANLQALTPGEKVAIATVQAQANVTPKQVTTENLQALTPGEKVAIATVQAQVKATPKQATTKKLQTPTPGEKVAVASVKARPMATPKKVTTEKRQTFTPGEKVAIATVQAQVKATPKQVTTKALTPGEKVAVATIQARPRVTPKKVPTKKRQALTPSEKVTFATVKPQANTAPEMVTTEDLQTLTPGEKVAVFATISDESSEEPTSWYSKLLSNLRERLLRYVPFQSRFTLW